MTNNTRAAKSGNFFKAVSAVVWKDLQAEFRSRELFSAMLVFSLLIILIFNFALELDIKTRQSVTAGVLWATFAFAGTLGLNRSMAIEKDRGCLDGLLLAPVDRSAIYFGKVISNLAFMLIVEIIVLPVYSVLYGINLLQPGLLLVILLGAGVVVLSPLVPGLRPVVKATVRSGLLMAGATKEAAAMVSKQWREVVHQAAEETKAGAEVSQAAPAVEEAVEAVAAEAGQELQADAAASPETEPAA